MPVLLALIALPHLSLIIRSYAALNVCSCAVDCPGKPKVQMEPKGWGAVMTQFVVIEGYVDDAKSDPTTVLLVDGMVVSVSRAGIHKLATLDTGKSPLMRIFLEPDAEISVTFKASELMGGGVTPSSILKWVDDGGTLLKSRDDTLTTATITKYLDDGGSISKSRDDT